MSRIVTTSFASDHPHDVAKAERKGRTKAGLATGTAIDKILSP